MKVIDIQRHDLHDYIVTVEFETGLWRWRRRHTRQLIGRCTVWHYLPDFERAGTSMEMKMSNAIKKHEFEQKAGKK